LDARAQSMIGQQPLGDKGNQDRIAHAGWPRC
jgi:hypothetical protein